MEKLRFAPIIRVSTEEQERKGESLSTQKTQIINYVKALGGVIPEGCWEYCGQESATKRERILWEKLLDDSGKNIFDAVIVCDASRWSRNNLKSLEGLEMLRKNGIRFFIGLSEKDLNLPADRMTLGLFTTLNQFIAEEQTRKSQDNRIHRAKRGVPTAGKLPYGRLWNKKEQQWEIDPVKKDIIEQTAKRYLAGEGIKSIAKSFNVDASTLFKSLTQRCGDTWECRYKDKVTGKQETVVLTVPRLLDQSVIDEVNAKMQKNKTFIRGNRKHFYLLTGVIYCKRCGLKMTTFKSKRTQRYYRHSQYSKDCKQHKFVPAAQIESAVLLHLVSMFGDYEKLENAIKRASPDVTQWQALKDEHEQLTKEFKKNAAKKETVIEKIAEKLISDKEAESTLNKLRETELSISQRLKSVEMELSNIPNPESIRKASRWTIKMLKHITKNSPALIFNRSFEWKRKFVENAFRGINHNKSKYGVFIDFEDGRITYEIKGALIAAVGALPITDEQIVSTFHVGYDSKQFINIKNALHTVST